LIFEKEWFPTWNPAAAKRKRRVVTRCRGKHWTGRDDLAPRKHGARRRKLDKKALARHVDQYPDALLRERAAHFGVHINAVWVALRKEKIVKKTA